MHQALARVIRHKASQIILNAGGSIPEGQFMSALSKAGIKGLAPGSFRSTMRSIGIIGTKDQKGRAIRYTIV